MFTPDGIAKAKERGVQSKQQARELRERRGKGDTIKTLMRSYGISKGSVYNYLAES